MKTLQIILAVCFVSFSLYAQSVTPPWACEMPRPLGRTVCEAASEFLCVNTPPGSVVEERLVIQGRLNLESSTLPTLHAMIQPDATQVAQPLVLSEPLISDCWHQTFGDGQNVCLDDEGRFAVAVPLPQLGAYSIFMMASRAEGASAQKEVRVSRVTAPTLRAEMIDLVNSGDRARVTLKLENGKNLGTTTGGLWVSVTNQVSERSLRCATNVPSSSPGEFWFGVPLRAGHNQLTMNVCNAATGFEPANCPTLALAPTVREEPNPEIIVQAPAYGESLVLEFQVVGNEFANCENCVTVAVDGADPQIVPSRGGAYTLPIAVDEGYHLATITAETGGQKLVRSISFGSPEMVPPLEIPGALRLGISPTLLNEGLRPLLENYLASDDLRQLLSNPPMPSGDSNPNRPPLFPNAPAYCSESARGAPKMKLVGSPEIGEVEIAPFQFAANRLQTKLKAKNVSLQLQLINDADGDGRPDLEPLPLKIAFREITLTPQLDIQGPLAEGGLRFSSSATDCDYKRESSCLGIPALLSPKNFIGAAHPSGAFVTCDRSQGVSESMDEICHALNVLDRQTRGAIQEKVLDVINRQFACLGWRPLQFTTGDQIVTLDGIGIAPEGLALALGSRIPLAAGLKPWAALRQKLTAESDIAGGIAIPPSGISADVATALDKHLPLQALALDEAFFRKLDFDFDVECSGTGPKQALCNLRPRAQNIFGSIITDGNVLESDAPVRLVLTPSHLFPLHLDVVESDGTLAVSLTGWELAITANEKPIIAGDLSLQLRLQLSPPVWSETKPEQILLYAKIDPAHSRVALTPKEETNRTFLPGSLLLSNLQDTLQGGIDYFSQEGREIPVKIPHHWMFPGDSLLVRLGLPELVLNPQSLTVDFVPSSDRIVIKSEFLFPQIRFQPLSE